LSSPLSPFSPHSPTSGSPPYQSRSHPPGPLSIFDTRTTSPSPSEVRAQLLLTLTHNLCRTTAQRRRNPDTVSLRTAATYLHIKYLISQTRVFSRKCIRGWIFSA
jgi:hypothetical protein